MRFGGCVESNTYLGYVGFNISASGNNAGSINYTPIETNLTLSPAKKGTAWQFAGVNLSGLEFGKAIDPVVILNLSEQDSSSTFSDLKETQSFINEGMNTVRVPISWGYLQVDGAGKGPINLAYYNNYIRPLLQTLTHAKVYSIVDLHAYMRYSKFGEQYSGSGVNAPCPDGTLIFDEKAYESVWVQLTKFIQ